MLFQDATIINGMVRTKDVCDAPTPKDTYNQLKNMGITALQGYARRIGYSELSNFKRMDKEGIISELISYLHGSTGEKFLENPNNFRDSIYDSYTYKGIEYNQQELWNKLKEEGKTKKFFTLSEKEKEGRDGKYIIYRAPDGGLYAVTRDTNDADIEIEKLKKELKDIIEKYGEYSEQATFKKREIARLTKDIKINETPDSEFDADELAKGIKVEMEHTDNKEEATSIAKDHLQED